MKRRAVAARLAEAPSGALSAGTLVGGRWEVERFLARGGMGVIYVARHHVTAKRAALKVLDIRDLSSDIADRFRREARIPAEIGHEGVVEIFDADADERRGQLFLAMELLVGETLDSRMARGGTKPEALIDLILRALEPLSAAHEKGYVHRDLKPDNIFLVNGSNGSDEVKLLDFGIACSMAGKRLTLANTGMGTPEYMAPEQALDASTVRASADIWSIGVMLYEVLSGELPFD
jgi:serine/threonine-protein kinase